MKPQKPYILRALYEWIIDQGFTPHIIVAANAPHVQVPYQFIKDDKIILNITPSAITSLNMGNEWITFSARFGGVPVDLRIPVGAVLAIYAMENGVGNGFEIYDPQFESTETIPTIDSPPQSATKKSRKKSHKPTLTIVK